jgi:hypothetical protein
LFAKRAHDPGYFDEITRLRDELGTILALRD